MFPKRLISINSLSTLARGSDAERVLGALDRIHAQVERLNDNILYVPDIEGLSPTGGTARRLHGLREARALLEPVQVALGGDTVSSGLIETPDKMERAMLENPGRCWKTSARKLWRSRHANPATLFLLCSCIKVCATSAGRCAGFCQFYSIASCTTCPYLARRRRRRFGTDRHEKRVRGSGGSGCASWFYGGWQNKAFAAGPPWPACARCVCPWGDAGGCATCLGEQCGAGRVRPVGAEFALGDVRQRMRWIEPGVFLRWARPRGSRPL